MDRCNSSSRRCIRLEHVFKLIMLFSCIAPVALVMFVGTEIAPASHEVDDMVWGSNRRQLTWIASVFGHEKLNSDDDVQDLVSADANDDQSRYKFFVFYIHVLYLV